MKYKLLCYVALSLLPCEILAQDFSFTELDKEKKVSISVGVKGGLNRSTLRSSSKDRIKADFGFRTGFNAGAALQFRFFKRNQRSDAETGLFAIQPEISYILLGGNIEKEGNGTIAETKCNVTWGYILMPVMFQVYPKKNIYFEFGPEFAYNIKPNSEVVNVGSYSLDMSSYKSKDIMLGVGAGVNLKDFSFGIRYIHGLSDYAKNLNWMNSAIQLNVGYFFKLGNKSSDNIIISL